MGFLRKLFSPRAGGRPAGDGGTGAASAGTPAGAGTPGASAGTNVPPDERVTIALVLHAEHDADGSLSLQGSIQAVLVADALADRSLRAVLACDTPSCRGTAEPIAAKHDAVELENFDAPAVDAALRARLADLHSTYAGGEIVLVTDDTLLKRIVGALDELPPQERSVPQIAPASITRLRLRADLSYSVSINDTEHLDDVTGSDRFRML